MYLKLIIKDGIKNTIYYHVIDFFNIHFDSKWQLHSF